MLLTQEEWERIDKAMLSLDERHAIGTAVQDLFALGCLLHAEGRKEAGVKAIDTALKAISLDKKSKLLFLKIIDNIEGNEREFFNRISAHCEIKELLRY
ncbi:hypothetical protein [Methylomonas koyamae]|uniref:hypothetical protein n=1 Tax=Methylomonas koyamae TaxID=702114 RepID=UPI002873106A|nr:hypothetical protein [Methylomonas koyamae]WNB74722.1 hypothetical protein RI210_15730 [Methylomonas koyamae]